MRKLLALYLPFVLVIVLVTVLTGTSLSRSDVARLKTIENDQITLGSHIIGEFLAASLGQIAGMLREPEFNRAYRLPIDEAKTAVQKEFVTLLYRNRPYHQVRWLSKEGDELVRVHDGEEIPSVIPHEKLVNKSDQDWFKGSVAQPPGGVYVSTIELGHDTANVVEPTQPVVRFGVRLPTEQGRDPGLMVFNVRPADMFRRLVDITAGLDEELMLLDPQGYWLLAPDPEDAFGFALGSPEASFARRQPAEWARISTQPAGQMLTSSGLWTWSTIDPAAILGGEITAAETWKLVAHMPAATIAAVTWKRWWPLLLLAGTTTVMMLFGVYHYRKLWLQREVAASELVLTAEKASLRDLAGTLERRVEERTSELAQSQLSFRLLAENASDVVFKTDMAGIVTYVSPSSIHSLGRVPERMVGTPFRNLVHPDEWDAIESLEDQMRRGTPGNAEARLRIGEDGYQWFSMSMKPLLDDNGVVSSCVGGLRDIQREVQTREAIKAERQRWKATIDGMLDPVVLMQPVRDTDGHVTDFIFAEANPAACAWLQMDREDLLGRRLLELFPAMETTGLMKLYRETAETGRQSVIDNFPFPVGNETRWLDIRGVRVDERVSLVWRDETERHRQQEVIANERKHLADVIEGSDTGTWEWHVPTGEVVVNDVVAKLLGYRREELQPMIIGTLEKLTHPDDLAHAKSLLEQCFRRDVDVYECEARMRHRNGEWVWIYTRGRVVEWTGDGKPLRMLGTHRDITASMKVRQELEHRATTDPLTGLCNRREFASVAHRELSRASRQGTPLSLLMMDIDKFKVINDTYGHDVGDAVLKAIAGICAPQLRKVDILARVGGEEFAVLLPDTPIDGATQVAERIREAIGRESVPAGDGKMVSFTVSVGVAEHDGEAADLEALTKRSDEALYRAKKTGGNRVCAGETTTTKQRQKVAVSSPPMMS